jgi:hypothetical protein
MDFSEFYREAANTISKKWVDGWDDAGFLAIMVVISATAFVAVTTNISLTFVWWCSFLLGGFVLGATTLRTKSWRRVERGKLDDRASASLGLTLCFLIMAVLGSGVGETAFVFNMPLFWVSYVFVFFVTILMTIRFVSKSSEIAFSRIFIFHTIFLLGVFVVILGVLAAASLDENLLKHWNKLVALALLFGGLAMVGVARIIGFMKRTYFATRHASVTMPPAPNSIL